MKPHARERRKADLHLHSTCSDGLWPPERVVAKAARAGISVMALTDHDTTEGWDAASRAAAAEGIELIPGIEISVDHGERGERHLLAYGVDPSEPGLARALAENVAARDQRVQRMVDALAKEGVELRVDEVLAQAKGNVGRPHVADALVRRGAVRSRQEAFDRWLGDGKPAHVKKINVEVSRAIALVHDAGGVAVLAHPGRRWDPAALEDLVRHGLDGLEAHHPSHSPSQAKAVEQLAARWGLLVTGGSDCHGDEEGERAMHAMSVPVTLAERVLERVAARHAGGGARA